MAGVITTGNISRLTVLGINKVFGQAYDEISPQWPMLVDKGNSTQAFEVDQQFEGLGLAPVKEQGDGVAYDSQQEGFTPKYEHLTYAKGIIATKEALRDNLYNLFAKKARVLAFSFRQTEENVVANVYNRGFNASFVMISGDGQPLFSTAHVNGPSDSTTFSNTLAIPAALSEASLEDMLIQIRQATDPRGNRISLKPQRLIVSPENSFEAERILASNLQNDTANNAINAVRSTGMLRDGYTVNDYMSSASAWFIKTNSPDGVKHISRQAVEFGEDTDFGTSNLRMKADQRYSAGWSDPRGAYGTAGI